MALRAGSEIVCPEDLLDEAGIESEVEEDEVARFKEFLDEVSPEDFEQPGGQAPGAT